MQEKILDTFLAFKNNADVIIETDDDNYPYDNFFEDKQLIHNAKIIKNKNDWINIYKVFLKNINCWPRGLPLNEITNNKINFGIIKKMNFIYSKVCKATPTLMQYFD